MATFGHVATGTSQAAPMNADVKFALKTVAPEDGTVTSVLVDMANLGTEIQAFRAAVYNDAPTISGATLVDASEAVLLSPGTARGWVAFNTNLNAVVAGGATYWLTLHAGPTGGHANFWYDPGVGSELIATDTFMDGTSSTFGSASQLTNSLAIYAEYNPVAQSVPAVARVVIGDESMMVAMS